jgi:hypothetical protein
VMLETCYICKRISCRCSSGIAVGNVIGTYGVWVSNGRQPMVPQHMGRGYGCQAPRPKQPTETEQQHRDRAAWERVKRRTKLNIKRSEIQQLKPPPPPPQPLPPPRPPPPPPPPQPPQEPDDDLLLEYAKATHHSTKGYWNDRVFFRRRMRALIRLHAERIRRREEE